MNKRGKILSESFADEYLWKKVTLIDIFIKQPNPSVKEYIPLCLCSYNQFIIYSIQLKLAG